MSKAFLARIADQVLNRPLLIHPSKAETIFGVLEGRITISGPDAEKLLPEPEASRFKGGYRRPSGESTRYTRISGDTALVSITGSLVNRGAWIGAYSGLTSYEGIGAQIDEIADDRSIRHVALDVDSYGGEATGMDGLAAKIRALRRTKYVVAIVNDVAASAGYGIASAADEIVVSPTSIVGSIGVVMLHLDRSGELQSKGIRPTLIHAGAKKVDGNPFGPLPENVRADMQKDVMAFYDQFLAAVEAGRGKRRLSAEKARKTEADTFIGQEAISLGLADRMASLDEVLADLSRRSPAARKRKPRGHTTMRHDDFEMSDAAVATILKAERTRIASILNSDAGKARPKAALALALAEASPDATAAISMLGSMPEEARLGGESAVDFEALEQRATAGQEFGAGKSPGQIDAEAVQSAWAKAIAATRPGA